MRILSILTCLAIAATAHADVLCRKKNGVVVARADACKGKEVALDLARFGAAGPQGEPGPQGDTGSPGSKGDQGDPGPLISTAPSGFTQRGFFGGGAAVGTDARVEVALSYPIPLAANVTTHLIPVAGPTPPACPGSVGSPAAAAGHLCVFFGWIDGTCGSELSAFGHAGDGDTQYGAVVVVGPTTPGQCDFSGTWAVTAP